MSFLPEDDRDYLELKGLPFELKEEHGPDGTARHGLLFPAFDFSGGLFSRDGNGTLVPCPRCKVLVLIPAGYSTTRLDSFYTSPRLHRSDGALPDRAAGEADLFGERWQFWSRHLSETEWRAGIDGIDIYLQYIRRELRAA